MSTEEARRAIHGLELYPKLILLQRLLSRMGFGEVSLQNRLTVRQASLRGGHELLCRFDIGGFPASAVVKVVTDSVHKRMLSELAGTVVADRATLGLLIATGPANPVMKIHKALLRPAQVEFIDGNQLVALLQRYSIGVRPFGEPDHEYLQTLRAEAPELIRLLRKVNR